MGCLILVKLTTDASRKGHLFFLKDEFFKGAKLVEEYEEKEKKVFKFYVKWPENKCSYHLKILSFDKRIFKCEIIS